MFLCVGAANIAYERDRNEFEYSDMDDQFVASEDEDPHVGLGEDPEARHADMAAAEADSVQRELATFGGTREM